MIDKITPVQKEDGSYASILDLKLETQGATAAGRLRRSSSGPRSALGLKYVQITRGTSTQGFEDGDRIPLSSYAKTRPVDIDEFYSMFDDQDPRRGPGERGRLRQRLRRSRREHQPRDRGARAAGHQRRGRVQEHHRRRAPTSRTSSRSRATPRASWRRSRRSRRALFANLDHDLHGVRRGVAPLHPAVHHAAGPSGLDTATEVFPKVMPFFENTEQFFTELQPGIERAARFAQGPRRRLRDGRHRDEALGRAQQPADRLPARASALRAGSGRPDRARAT